MFAIIAIETGAIIRMGECDIDDLVLQATPMQDVIAPVPDGIRDDTHFWDGDAFQPLPPRPGIWAEWDGQAWIDPRTPADFAAALQSARDAARRDKSGLLMDLAMMGVLTVPEAIQAARGDIPESFEPALSSLPEEAQGIARIKWAGDQTISRTNPLILLAAYAKGITDEQLDQAFGVQAPV
ncbi:hypothetical protein [Paracoccus sp. NSM]|uniref:hypothetical protein n=1 Tax=Paracoccus sp. NSM TaxID=3457784 RepID=UPI0040367A5E